MTASRAPSRPSSHSHPGDELLVAYLTSGLTPPERWGIDQHLTSCDACLRTVIMVHHRIGLEAEAATPVPAALQRRVAAVQYPAPESQPVQLSHTRSISRISERLSTVLRLPVLVPVALAAGALLVVMTQQLWNSAGTPRELSRGVQMPQQLRVTAPEAVVRVEPSVHAETVATLSRGAAVDVSDEQHEWYRVVLPDGKSGWVERRAFD